MPGGPEFLIAFTQILCNDVSRNVFLILTHANLNQDDLARGPRGEPANPIEAVYLPQSQSPRECVTGRA